MLKAIERQAAAGVSEADSLILVVDGLDGLTSSDEEIMSWLRKTHPDKPVTLAVNKCENVRNADTQVRSPTFPNCQLWSHDIKSYYYKSKSWKIVPFREILFLKHCPLVSWKGVPYYS